MCDLKLWHRADAFRAIVSIHSIKLGDLKYWFRNLTTLLHSVFCLVYYCENHLYLLIHLKIMNYGFVNSKSESIIIRLVDKIMLIFYLMYMCECPFFRKFLLLSFQFQHDIKFLGSVEKHITRIGRKVSRHKNEFQTTGKMLYRDISKHHSVTIKFYSSILRKCFSIYKSFKYNAVAPIAT